MTNPPPILRDTSDMPTSKLAAAMTIAEVAPTPVQASFASEDFTTLMGEKAEAEQEAEPTDLDTAVSPPIGELPIKKSRAVAPVVGFVAVQNDVTLEVQAPPPAQSDGPPPKDAIAAPDVDPHIVETEIATAMIPPRATVAAPEKQQISLIPAVGLPLDKPNRTVPQAPLAAKPTINPEQQATEAVITAKADVEPAIDHSDLPTQEKPPPVPSNQQAFTAATQMQRPVNALSVADASPLPTEADGASLPVLDVPRSEGADAKFLLNPRPPVTNMQGVVDQVIRNLNSQSTIKSDAGIELRLDPPELGRVRISLSGLDNALTAVVTADRSDVESLMRRHGDILQKALSEAGFDGATLSFGSEKKGDRAKGGQQQAILLTDSVENVAEGIVSVPAGRALPGGLDIRL